jgi:hypothetical protein
VTSCTVRSAELRGELDKEDRVLIFGEPYEAGNDTVIVTVVRKGWRTDSEHPVGIYTIRADSTTWTPAVDTSRHAVIGVCTGFVAAAIAVTALLRRPPWPDMTERVMIALAQGRRARRRLDS